MIDETRTLVCPVERIHRLALIASRLRARHHECGIDHAVLEQAQGDEQAHAVLGRIIDGDGRAIIPLDAAQRQHQSLLEPRGHVAVALHVIPDGIAQSIIVGFTLIGIHAGSRPHLESRRGIAPDETVRQAVHTLDDDVLDVEHGLAGARVIDHVSHRVEVAGRSRELRKLAHKGLAGAFLALDAIIDQIPLLADILAAVLAEQGIDRQIAAVHQTRVEHGIFAILGHEDLVALTLEFVERVFYIVGQYGIWLAPILAEAPFLLEGKILQRLDHRRIVSQKSPSRQHGDWIELPPAHVERHLAAAIVLQTDVVDRERIGYVLINLE